VIKPSKRRAGETSVIGWREIASLPALGLDALRAKIDTGARTSALHAVDLEAFDSDGVPKIGFHVPLPGRPRWERCVAPIVDYRQIKNTSGEKEPRYVVETTLVLGHRHWQIEVSLANREKMEFDLLLGRTAIRGRRLLVNPSRSFLAGAPVIPDLGDRALPEAGLIRTLERGNAPVQDTAGLGDK